MKGPSLLDQFGRAVNEIVFFFHAQAHSDFAEAEIAHSLLPPWNEKPKKGHQKNLKEKI